MGLGMRLDEKKTISLYLIQVFIHTDKKTLQINRKLKKMKHSLFLILIYLASTNAFGQTKQDTSCSGASSQTDYYKCLIKEYTYRDKLLNELYKKVIKKLGQKIF